MSFNKISQPSKTPEECDMWVVGGGGVDYTEVWNKVFASTDR